MARPDRVNYIHRFIHQVIRALDLISKDLTHTNVLKLGQAASYLPFVAKASRLQIIAVLQHAKV